MLLAVFTPRQHHRHAPGDKCEKNIRTLSVSHLRAEGCDSRYLANLHESAGVRAPRSLRMCVCFCDEGHSEDVCVCVSVCLCVEGHSEDVCVFL